VKRHSRIVSLLMKNIKLILMQHIEMVVVRKCNQLSRKLRMIERRWRRNKLRNPRKLEKQILILLWERLKKKMKI